MEVLIKIIPQEFIKNHFSTSIFSLDMLLKSSKSCFYNRGPNSRTLVGFGNFPKFKNLSQALFQNPRNWENSQSLKSLPVYLRLRIQNRVENFEPVTRVSWLTSWRSGSERSGSGVKLFPKLANPDSSRIASYVAKKPKLTDSSHYYSKGPRFDSRSG